MPRNTAPRVIQPTGYITPTVRKKMARISDLFSRYLTYAYGAGQKLATVTLRFTHSPDKTEWHITHSTRRDKSKFQLNNGPERSMDILMDDIVCTFLRQASERHAPASP